MRYILHTHWFSSMKLFFTACVPHKTPVRTPANAFNLLLLFRVSLGLHHYGATLSLYVSYVFYGKNYFVPIFFSLLPFHISTPRTHTLCVPLTYMYAFKCATDAGCDVVHRSASMAQCWTFIGLHMPHDAFNYVLNS